MTVRATRATRTPLPIGQTDTIFRATVKEDDGTERDVSGDTVEMQFQQPDGTVLVKVAATLSTRVGATSGEIEFVDSAGDYTGTLGDWYYWPITTNGSAGPFVGTPIRYTVGDIGR